MEITKDRWEELMGKVFWELASAKDMGDNTTDCEIQLIMSVLKNNTPFEVVEEE